LTGGDIPALGLLYHPRPSWVKPFFRTDKKPRDATVLYFLRREDTISGKACRDGQPFWSNGAGAPIPPSFWPPLSIQFHAAPKGGNAWDLSSVTKI